MLNAYVVFGDSRRAENRVAFYGQVEANEVHLGQPVTIQVADEIFDGVVINAGANADGEPTDRDILTILADEALPSAAVQATFLANGYELAERTAPVRMLPHRSEVYVFAGHTPGTRRMFRKAIWVTDAMVTGQRHSMQLEPAFGFTQVICLTMENRPGALPLTTVLVEDFTSDEEAQLEKAGWQRFPISGVAGHDFEQLISVCKKIDTQVAYLLSAPLVTGVHVAAGVTLDDTELSLLPVDVRDEYLAAVSNEDVSN